MPIIRFVETYSLAPDAVFDFFRRPANVVAIAPPGVDLTLIEGAESVSAGSVYLVQLRRVGLSQQIETEVVVADAPARLVERHLRGPFSRWVLERRFLATETGTELTEIIDYDPPGGLLGLMLTPQFIEEELRRAYLNRPERVLARLKAT